ncbi:MAG TPA: hypothetical protein VIL23_00405 [Clostridia bacterium]
MIETYFEQCNTLENPNANKGKRFLFKAIYYFSIILGIVLLFAIFSLPIIPKDASWQQVVVNVLIWLLMPASLFLGAFFAKKALNAINPIFDYVLNGKDFYILRILDNSKRKKYLQINVSQMSAMGKISLNSYRRYSADPNIKKIYALTNSQNEDNIYYLLYTDSGNKKLLHFEPNQECIMHLRRAIGRDIVSKD